VVDDADRRGHTHGRPPQPGPFVPDLQEDPGRRQPHQGRENPQRTDRDLIGLEAIGCRVGGVGGNQPGDLGVERSMGPLEEPRDVDPRLAQLGIRQFVGHDRARPVMDQLPDLQVRENVGVGHIIARDDDREEESRCHHVEVVIRSPLADARGGPGLRRRLGSFFRGRRLAGSRGFGKIALWNSLC
jgi:hypothetical protein